MHILVQTDSTMVMHYLSRTGGTWRLFSGEGRGNYSVVSDEVEDLSNCSPYFGPDNVKAGRLSRRQVKNLHRLECSTGWSLDPTVTFFLFDILGPTYSRPLHHSVEQ